MYNKGFRKPFNNNANVWLIQLSSNHENFRYLTEKYITIHALPNEEFNSWLRWKGGFNFDNIVLRTEADICMTHFLNVSEDVYEANPDPFRVQNM